MKNPRKFKLGDRVSIAHSGYNNYPLGTKGTIAMYSMRNQHRYHVLFDTDQCILVLNQFELNLVESDQLENIVELGYN